MKVLVTEKRARWFFAAHLQSALGTGGANALFGAVRELGQLAGPICAAGVLLFGGPQGVLVLNAVTFACSALMLSRLRGHIRAAPAADSGPGEDGSVLRLPGVAGLILTSGAVLLAAGMTNVAELVLAKDELHAGGSGFGLLGSAVAPALAFALVGGATLFILLAASFRTEAQHGPQVVVATTPA